MTSAPPLLLLVGSPRHGVVQYAADVASAALRQDARVRTEAAADVADAEVVLATAERVHLHVTDRLFGSSPEAAADVIERWASTVRLSVTLHDVPQTSDGTMLQRRCAAYARIADAAGDVVVNSVHEQLLVDEFLPRARPTYAIPLGTRRGTAPAAPTSDEASSPRDLRVMLAGYVYPGKGHAAALRAAADAARALRSRGESLGRVAVRAIGGPSRGHEDDVSRLREQAARLGVDLEVTGFLDDDAFARELAADGIPLAAHEHVSASRSMLDWVEQGRRPLVVDSRYAAEMDELRPGTLARYREGELAERLVAAWLDPARTRLDVGRRLAPTLDDAAADYLVWWASL
ncbi:hypothetical protein AB3M83_02985 [Microbacterium sp. 179-B 1A2 NHS]|uniref:hypothetical protein n=1 Tax=Microbacterium sp. 179-B 1A2 NHS TaxID=3142383 RepID=UPI0039A1CCFD